MSTTSLLFQIQAIENIEMGQICKLFLEWKVPWWAPNESGIQLAWPSDQNNIHINGLSSQHWYRALCNFSEVQSQPHLLQTWIAGEAAKIVDQLDDEEVIMTLSFLCVCVLKISIAILYLKD